VMVLASGSLRMAAAQAACFPGRVGVLLAPRNANGPCSAVRLGLPWAVDNGAYSGFDAARFRRLLAKAAGRPRLLWVVAPDVVADARATRKLFDAWRPELAAAGVPVAFCAQDGAERLELPWGEFACLFVGGSTRWKLSTAAAELMAEARARGQKVHVGRVNSLRRLRTAYERGADSVDGSGYSRWHHRTAVHRPDMSLRRHLAFLRTLEAERTLFD